MSELDKRIWWHVEGGTGGWHMVGCRYDTLADASAFADSLRAHYPEARYRVVRFESVREIEENA